MTEAPSTDCLFCKIAAGEIPATIVERTGTTVAFRDVSPVSPTHILVIPTRHVADLDEALAVDPGIVPTCWVGRPRSRARRDCPAATAS